MGNNRTYIEPDSVNGSADQIGGLLDDQTPFEEVSKIQTFSGNFPAARSMDTMLSERGKALLVHAKGVQIACHEMRSGLHAVVNDLTSTDGSNASSLDRDRAAYHDVNVARVQTFQQSQAAAKPNQDA